MTKVLIAVFAFAVGVLTGVRLTWWHMNRVWERNPYRFKTIVEGVIALREARQSQAH